MSQNTESAILKAQSLLEANEDIIGGIIENMQLVRLDDCLKLYSLLHNNLVSLGNELDNYPYCDPYKNLSNFPDEIMRRKVVDTLRPPKPNNVSNDPMPKAPLPPPCNKCALQNVSSTKCRIELGHVEPSCKFSITDREQYVRATQILELRYKEQQQELHKTKLNQLQMMKKQLQQGGMNNSTEHSQFSQLSPQELNNLYSAYNTNGVGNGAIIDNMNNMKALKGKRLYRRWTNEERHIVCLGVFIYGARNTRKIAEMLYDRSKNQVKSYIAKSMSSELLIELAQGKLPLAPTEFNSNTHLTQLFSTKYPEVTQNTASDKLLYDILNVAPSTNTNRTQAYRNSTSADLHIPNNGVQQGVTGPLLTNTNHTNSTIINGNPAMSVPSVPYNGYNMPPPVGDTTNLESDNANANANANASASSRRIGKQDWDMLMRIAARTSSA